jgi:hypothetical protein
VFSLKRLVCEHGTPTNHALAPALTEVDIAAS